MRILNEGSAGVTRLRRKAKAGVKQNPSKKWYKYQKELKKRDAKPESVKKGIENKMKKRQLGEGSRGIDRLNRVFVGQIKKRDALGAQKTAGKLRRKEDQGEVRAGRRGGLATRQAQRNNLKKGITALDKALPKKKKVNESATPITVPMLMEALIEGSRGLSRLGRVESAKNKTALKSSSADRTPGKKYQQKAKESLARQKVTGGGKDLPWHKGSTYGLSKTQDRVQAGTRKFRKHGQQGWSRPKKLGEALETRGEKNNPFKSMTKGQYKSEKRAMRKEVNPGGRKKSIKNFIKGRPGKGALPDPRGGNQKRAEDSVRTPPASRKTLNRAKGNPVRSAWVAKKNEKAVNRFMSRLPEK